MAIKNLATADNRNLSVNGRRELGALAKALLTNQSPTLTKILLERVQDDLLKELEPDQRQELVAALREALLSNPVHSSTLARKIDSKMETRSNLDSIKKDVVNVFEWAQSSVSSRIDDRVKTYHRKSFAAG